jgi:MoaE-MoaD fusion protein
MRVELKYFAVVRERVGCSEETLELPGGATVADLWSALEQRYDALRALRPHVRVAVNMEFAGDAEALREGDEIALIPPVAGGIARARLTDAPLDPQALARRVRQDQHGALVTFVGVVRNTHLGREVSYLEYEAYGDMATRKLEEILAECDARWPGCQVAVEHRTGRLEIGEAAVVIAVASPHRKDAFHACEHVIDRIKQDVPIWKREVGPDGSSWVGMGS